MADEIQGKNWYKEVKSPKDTVPYKERLEFYLKRAERKVGLDHLAKDFEITLKSQIERGRFKSLEDLKKVSKKEYPVRNGDTLFKVLFSFFKDLTDPAQAQKETYLSLAYLMKTQDSSNVDKLFSGGSVLIEEGRLTVKDAEGKVSYELALLRPETQTVKTESKTVSSSKVDTPPSAPVQTSEPFPVAGPIRPTSLESPKAPLPAVLDEEEEELVRPALPAVTPDADLKVQVGKKDVEYLNRVKGQPEAQQFKHAKQEMMKIEQAYDQVLGQNLGMNEQDAQKVLKDTAALLQEAKNLPSNSYLADRVDVFQAEIEEFVQKIEEETQDLTLANLAREIQGLAPIVAPTEAAPIPTQKFEYQGRNFELSYSSKVERQVTLDPEKGDRYFYDYIVRQIEGQNLFSGDENLSLVPLDSELEALLVDQVIGACRTLNPSVDLDEPSSFNQKKLLMPEHFELKAETLPVSAAPDESVKIQVEKGSISKLLKLGGKNPYYVLNLPSEMDVHGVFDWKTVEAFNKTQKIPIKKGEPFRIPASQLAHLKYQNEVRFIELSLKDPLHKEAVLAALTKDGSHAKEWAALFTESFYYKKSVSENRIVIPMALLKEGWEQYLLQDYKVQSAKFRSNSVYVTGEYNLFVKHATSVENLKVQDREELIRAGQVEAVKTEGRKFRFKGQFSSEKEKYLRPYANTTLGEIADQFYAKTGYMLMVTSAFRTPAEQKSLAENNSAATTGVSTHSLANSFDIANGRFIAPDGREVTWSGTSGAEREKLTTFRPVMEKVLIGMQKEGKLMALRELYAWHIMAANPAIGDGTQLAPERLSIDSELEEPALNLEALRGLRIDFQKIPEFQTFSLRLIRTIKERKEAGNKMKISEVQAMIQKDLLKKLRESGQTEVAQILEGRTFEMANMINILVSTQQRANLDGSYCIYDERPEVASEIVGFQPFAEKYSLFKEARTSKTSKLRLLNRSNDLIGDYNMYNFLTKSNVQKFIDPSILMAKIAQETNFTFVKNLGGEMSDYTGQTVFGYFQMTAKQDAKTERRAKEIFNQLTGIPGTKFDFKEFQVPYGNGKYYANPRAEIALAIAMYEKNTEKIRAANGNSQHIDEELLTVLSYNHGTAYIEDILRYGVTISQYQVPGGYKLSYVDSSGKIHTKTVSDDQRQIIKKNLSSSKLSQLRNHLKASFGINFVSGRSVNVRISEVEKVASMSRNGKGQLYVSQVFSKSVMLKYIDKNNYSDMGVSALADAMTVLSAQKPVSNSQVSSIRPLDRR